MPSRSLPLLLCVAASLALPGAAHAATLTSDGSTLTFTGGAGGTYVDFEKASGGRVWIQESLDDKVTGGLPAGCERDPDSEELLCALPSGGIRAVMNEGEDKVSVRSDLGVPVHLDGGAANDALSGAYDGGAVTLIGGPGNDSLLGGGGDDVLEGGEGDDALKGGKGRDQVLGGDGVDRLNGDEGGAIEADVLDGGPGYDTIESEWSTVQREGKGLVTISLDNGADDGFSGEGDDVKGVEKLATSTGGSYTGTDAPEELFVGAEATTVISRGGDDTIYTSYSNDTIDAGAGNDTVRGYNGDDTITGGPGQDTIFGDTQGQTCMVLSCSTYIGNDVIDARDGERDSVDCGLGTDTVLADAVDVTTNCEDVKVGGGTTPPENGGGGGGGGTTPPATAVSVAAKKLKAALATGLTVKLTGMKPGKRAVKATLGGITVAKGTIKVAANGTGKGVVRFTARARKLLKGQRKVTLKLTVAGGGSAKVTLKR